jgi:hypothetical protein
MNSLLPQLADIDRRNQEGSLSESGYRRAKERLLAEYAERPGHEVDHHMLDRSQTAPQSEARHEAASNRHKQKDRPSRDPAVDAGSPALDALILFIVTVVFSELLAQGLGNGLPYHKFGSQLVFLPGTAMYVINALEGAGFNNPQIVLGALLIPCYLVVPWGAYRSLKKSGGVAQAFAGYTIAFRYLLVTGVVAYVQLALLSDYPINIETHLAIPALFGLAILGTVLALVILVRRLIAR